MKTRKIYNITACRLETATVKRCPWCKGDGARKGETCEYRNATFYFLRFSHGEKFFSKIVTI